MKRLIQATALSVFGVGMLVAGYVLGGAQGALDPLCPGSHELYSFQSEMVTSEGIVFPANVPVPMKQCAYAMRFSVKFFADHASVVPAIHEDEPDSLQTELLPITDDT